jgi:hypothetical protein
MAVVKQDIKIKTYQISNFRKIDSNTKLQKKSKKEKGSFFLPFSYLLILKG